MARSRFSFGRAACLAIVLFLVALIFGQSNGSEDLSEYDYDYSLDTVLDDVENDDSKPFSKVGRNSSVTPYQVKPDWSEEDEFKIQPLKRSKYYGFPGCNTRRYGFTCAFALDCGRFPKNNLPNEEPQKGYITEGKRSRSNQWPAFAQIVNLQKGKAICGGSIVSSLHVVTAASCIEGLRMRDIMVVVGANLQFAFKPNSTEVDKFPGPNYQMHQVRDSCLMPLEWNRDQAWLMLKEPALYWNDDIQPACYGYTHRPQPIMTGKNSLCYIVGIGPGSIGQGEDTPDEPQYIRHRRVVVNYDRCKGKKNRLCLDTYEPMTKELSPTCLEDYGGPLYCYGPDKQWILMGTIKKADPPTPREDACRVKIDVVMMRNDFARTTGGATLCPSTLNAACNIDADGDLCAMADVCGNLYDVGNTNPYYVEVVMSEEGSAKRVCGGTLVTKDTVFTLRSCLYDNYLNKKVSPESVTVRLGFKYEGTGEAPGPKTAQVRAIWRHLWRDKEYAQIKLKDRDFTSGLLPACWPYRNRLPKYEVQCFAHFLDRRYPNNYVVSVPIHETVCPQSDNIRSWISCWDFERKAAEKYRKGPLERGQEGGPITCRDFHGKILLMAVMEQKLNYGPTILAHKIDPNFDGWQRNFETNEKSELYEKDPPHE